MDCRAPVPDVSSRLIIVRWGEMNDAVKPLNLLDLPPLAWRQALAAAGLPAYRGQQLAHWVFGRGVFDFAAMTDLPVKLRTDLPTRFRLEPPTVDTVFRSADHSRRYLLRVGAGEVIESVTMPYARRTTLCISSQVGCRFACGFCQTGQLKLRRSLSAGEILGQVLRLRAEIQEPCSRLNVVFMGQGEPLDNAAAVTAAVEAMQDPNGLALGWRRITVSTVGLPPAILALAELGTRRPRIAVSLNASTDEVRSELMPVNRKYPIAALIGALREVPWRNREKVTCEYVLLSGINDTETDARRLGGLLNGLPAKVNLIPWNPIPGMPYQRPSSERIERFRRAALSSGLDALVRYSRGADIGAACGQLATAAESGTGH